MFKQIVFNNSKSAEWEEVVDDLSKLEFDTPYAHFSLYVHLWEFEPNEIEIELSSTFDNSYDTFDFTNRVMQTWLKVHQEFVNEKKLGQSSLITEEDFAVKLSSYVDTVLAFDAPESERKHFGFVNIRLFREYDNDENQMQELAIALVGALKNKLDQELANQP